MDLAISLSLSVIRVERECESGRGRVWSPGNGGPLTRADMNVCSFKLPRPVC